MPADTFHVMSAVFSMVLGLSVTRLLLGLVTIFRIRRHVKIDWLPLVWAVALFIVQMQYWWAINALPQVKTDFSFVDFVSLVILTLMLFLAAALLLPSRAEDETPALRDYFQLEGRYALLALAAFHGLGFLTNLFQFGDPLNSPWAYLDAPMIVLPVVAFFTPRRMQVVTTLIYMAVMVLDTVVSTGG